MKSNNHKQPSLQIPRRIGRSLFVWIPLVILLCLWRLDSAPPLWFDEGWTLTVARNWVETGHYGRYLAGTPISPRLAAGPPAAPPVVLPVALSFRLLGIGAWQGRLPGVFFTLGTLALVYYLARRLYNRPIAIGTLAVLLLTSAHAEVHPIILGRQVLAEMPMLFFLLAGYACFLSAWRRPHWFIVLAVLFWGIGLRTKLQPLPFWMASLVVPLAVTLYKRKWKSAGLPGIGLVGSLVVFQSLEWLQQRVLLGPAASVSEPQLIGLYDITALVPLAHVRLLALFVSLTLGLPTLLGLCYAAWRLVVDRDKVDLGTGPEVVRLTLLTFAGSWFAWYALLSVRWGRYLFPATFVGSIFVAGMLYELSGHFALAGTLRRAATALRRLRFNQEAGALLAVVLLAMTIPGTLQILYQSYVTKADASVLQVATFLNTRTPTDALIETYDSELFFLLERPYHYPPDQVEVELDRRKFLGQDVPINYDPLAAGPDYLVVGPFSRMWNLYREVLDGDHFTLLEVIGQYAVYQRKAVQ